MSEQNIALVTGARKGIGRALTEVFSARGYRVFGADYDWPEGEKTAAVPIVMDIRNSESVIRGVKEVMDAAGRIDLLINNAGITHFGTVEDTTEETMENVIQTNYIGAFRLIRAVLPSMRDRKSGTIINISSLSGRISIPFQSQYVAGKAALTAMTRVLWMETKPFGIRVYLIEPSDVRTSIWKSREPFAYEDTEYAPYVRNFLTVKNREMSSVKTTPGEIASRIARIAESGTGRFRHPLGAGAMCFSTLLRLLPESSFYALLRKRYGL